MVLTKIPINIAIKQARKKKSKELGRKYTQDMLSKHIGISRSYLADIESGKAEANYMLLHKISEACNVDFSFFGNLDEEITKYVEKKYPKLDINAQKEIINFYKNSKGSKYDMEWFVDNYYYDKENNNYNKSFDEWSSTTSTRVPYTIPDRDIKKIPIFKELVSGNSYKNLINKIDEISFPKDLNIHNKYTGIIVTDDSLNLKAIHKDDTLIYQENIEVEDSVNQILSKLEESNSLSSNNKAPLEDASTHSESTFMPIFNGDLVVVKFNDNPPCIRRFSKSDNIIVLDCCSSNPQYKPEILDLNKDFVQVLGKVVKAIINL